MSDATLTAQYDDVKLVQREEYDVMRGPARLGVVMCRGAVWFATAIGRLGNVYYVGVGYATRDDAVRAITLWADGCRG